MNDYTVYVHILPNQKLYIGITHLKPEYRYGKQGSGYRGCKLFWKAIQKYGWDNIKHIVLFENLTKDVACLFEQCLIKKYRTNDPIYGYNNSCGGESGSFGHAMSEESKRKISQSRIGKHLSDETKIKIGKANSIALKGRKLSEETKEKIRKNSAKPFLGKKHSEESKRKNAEAHIGKKYHLGYKHSEEAKEKMRLAKLGKKRGSWTDAERKAHMEANERRRKEKLQIKNT